MSDGKRQPWYVRPQIVLSLLAVAILVAASIAPRRTSDNDNRMSSSNSGRNGARLLFELAGRLGWRVTRAEQRVVVPDTTETVVILAPKIGWRGADVHQVLEAVRAGGGLLVIADEGASLFGDSLGLRSAFGDMLARDSARACPDQSRFSWLPDFGSAPYLTTMRWLDDSILARSPGLSELRNTRLDTLLQVTVDDDSSVTARPVLLGMQLGAGRVVIGFDGDVLRNDFLRTCRSALDVAAVRALEFLGNRGERNTFVFDEYHHDMANAPGSLPAVLGHFARTRPGQAFYQLSAAGLLLLLALGARVLSPAARTRVERRSPIEHVDALARAYAGVGATRTAAQRLVRGLRRRMEGARVVRARGVDDLLFLQQIAENHPALQRDVAALRAALEQGSDSKSLPELATRVASIEDTLIRR